MWQVTAGGVHAVQRLAVACVDVAALTELELEVQSWRPPIEGWIGSPGLPGVASFEMEARGAGAHVRLQLTRPTDAAVLLAGVVRCLRPVPAGSWSPEITFTAGLPADAASLAPRLRDVLRTDDDRDRHLRRADVLLTGAAPVEGIDCSTTVVVGPDRWTRDGIDFEVSVDPTIHRPLGRRSSGAVVVAGAQVDGDTLAIRGADIELDLVHSVTAADARRLRSITGLVVDGLVPPRLERQLHACGVVVTADRSSLPAPDDHLGWQSRSVFERRHALRQYAPSAALDEWPTVTVIMATHRADHLDGAVAALAGLRYPRLEVVIGAHGPAVDAEQVRGLMGDLPHEATVVPVNADRNLGEVLQACTDRAQGSLITKMDDDDVYGPEHIWDLVLAHQYSGAQLVGKALDWIHLESENATLFRPVFAAEKYADFVAGGTILISHSDLMAVGGWRPVPKSVDRALLDRVIAAGGLVYRTHGLGYVYVRRQTGHTATVNDAHFLTKVTERRPGMVAHEAFGTAVTS